MRPRDRTGRIASRRNKHNGSDDREHGLLLHVAGPATPCPPGPEDLALALATATERSTNISGCRSLRQEVDSTTKVPRTGGQEP